MEKEEKGKETGESEREGEGEWKKETGRSEREEGEEGKKNRRKGKT